MNIIDKKDIQHAYDNKIISEKDYKELMEIVQEIEFIDY